MNSTLIKKEGRLKEAKEAFSKFQKSYPDSDKMKEVQNDVVQIDKEISSTKQQMEKILQNN